MKKPCRSWQGLLKKNACATIILSVCSDANNRAGRCVALRPQLTKFMGRSHQSIENRRIVRPYFVLTEAKKIPAPSDCASSARSTLPFP